MPVNLVKVLALALLVATTAGCRTTRGRYHPKPVTTTPPTLPVLAVEPVACGTGKQMVVHFFDVAQALSAFVELPDGNTILVDMADSPSRQGCGTSCSTAHDHLIERLGELTKGHPVSMVWVTHQHADHLGGAKGVFRRVHARFLVDNGEDDGVKQVDLVHDSARGTGAELRVVSPGHTEVPLQVAEPLRLTAVVPSRWTANCSKNKNDCSIGLRIDYCLSSVLFTGDAEAEEEADLQTGPVTLLQVGHHGSNTSSTAEFIERVRPKYAVISSGKPLDGVNASYCHPRQVVVERLTAAMGGPGKQTVTAFDGTTGCKGASAANWHAVPAADQLFSTARDGDVTLSTTGDGVFLREP